jgi:hypothetical protein
MQLGPAQVGNIIAEAWYFTATFPFGFSQIKKTSALLFIPQKEAVMARFKVTFQHFPGET